MNWVIINIDIAVIDIISFIDAWGIKKNKFKKKSC